jgi:hypothetical protein
MDIFDLQFWVICVIFSAVIFFSARWIKKILISTVSESVAQVVADQWALMFLKLDSYKETVENHNTKIESHASSIIDLKSKCSELEKKAKLNRKDIDDILEKVRNLK